MRTLRTHNAKPVRYELYVTVNENGDKEVKVEKWYCSGCGKLIDKSNLYQECCPKCGQWLDWRKI